MHRFSKRFTVVTVVAASVILAGGVAFAFWTAGGAGAGNAATGTSADVTVVQTSTVTAMGPGIAPQALSGNFNNASSGPVYVTTVTASISGVTKAAGAAAGTCTAADYALTGAAMPVGAQVPAGTAQGAWSGATIAFANNAAVNQDGCKGATVTLAYAAS